MSIRKIPKYCEECKKVFFESWEEHLAKVHGVTIVYAKHKGTGYKIYPKTKPKTSRGKRRLRSRK